MYTIYIVGIVILFVKIAHQDQKEKIIADGDILFGLGWVGLFSYFEGIFLDSFLGAWINGFCHMLWYFAVRKIYKAECFGQGDVTLSFLIGATVGLSGLFQTQIITGGLCLLYIFFAILFKRVTWSAPIPLAPYYNSAALLYLLFHL